MNTNDNETEHVALKPALAELLTRLEQIKELIPVLQIRTIAFQIEDFNGLIEYFKTLLRTEQPQPTYNELMRRTRIAIGIAAIDICNGNKTHAANMLGMSRYGLQKIIKHLPGQEEETALLTTAVNKKNRWAGKKGKKGKKKKPKSE